MTKSFPITKFDQNIKTHKKWIIPLIILTTLRKLNYRLTCI